MKRDEVLDVLLSMYETYQYLMTKLDITKETIDIGVGHEKVSDFEKEKILDVVESALSKHEEIIPDLKKLQEYIDNSKA